MDKVEVTQEDREAFRSICLLGDAGPNVSAMLSAGAWDDDPRMIDLARHRAAAEQRGFKRCQDAAVKVIEAMDEPIVFLPPPGVSINDATVNRLTDAIRTLSIKETGNG